MITRRDLGSWMEGPPSSSNAPGERLGLPAHGPGSIARFGRRILALMLDWMLCVGASTLFFNGDPWATLIMFAVAQIVMLAATGASIGHHVFRMRLSSLQQGRSSLLIAVIRTALLLLVIPPLIMDEDQRGLHDKLAGTMLLRR